MTVSERILIWNFKRKRRGAFDEIYSTYASRLYRFCLRLTSRSDDADDLLQDVFVAALGGLDKFQERSSISTWLYRIALMRWRTSQRNQQGRANDISLDESSSQVSNLGTITHDHSVDLLDIQQALNKLPQSHRDAFVLVKAEELTCREAGDVLDLPEGTVRYHVHCAVQALRKSVNLAEIAERHGSIGKPDTSSSNTTLLAVPAETRH